MNLRACQTIPNMQMKWNQIPNANAGHGEFRHWTEIILKAYARSYMLNVKNVILLKVEKMSGPRRMNSLKS